MDQPLSKLAESHICAYNSSTRKKLKRILLCTSLLLWLCWTTYQELVVGQLVGRRAERATLFKIFGSLSPFWLSQLSWGWPLKFGPAWSCQLLNNIVGVGVQSKSEAKTSSNATTVQVAARKQLLALRETRAPGYFSKRSFHCRLFY